MSEKGPTYYHPAVEEQFVTRGVDMGRMKNTELTREHAENENFMHDRGARYDAAWRQKLDTHIRHGVAKRALEMEGIFDESDDAIVAAVSDQPYEKFNNIESHLAIQEASDEITKLRDDTAAEHARARVAGN